MKVNLIQICRVNDAKAHDYVLSNRQLGFDVFYGYGYYWAYTVTRSVEGEYPEYITGFQGTWIQEDKQFYSVN